MNLSSEHYREIMIGDYVYITFKDGYGYGKDITHHYYITKIEIDDITINKIENVANSIVAPLHLIKNADGNWQIKEIEIFHSVNFVKNPIDTRYFERDYTQNPTKRIIYEKSEDYDLDANFTELKNGIILYQLRGNEPGLLGFFDPSNLVIKEPSGALTKESSGALTKDASSALTKDASNIFIGASFQEIPIPEPVKYYQKIMNLVSYNKENFNEILLYSNGAKYINTLNLNNLTITEYIDTLNLDNLTITEYDKNSKYHAVYPLRDKKILCILNYARMYILDLITKTKLNISYNSYGILRPNIYQASNDDIFLQFKAGKGMIEYHRVNIHNGSSIKIAVIDTMFDFFYIISILSDDTFLIFSIDLETVQIWNPITNQFTDTFFDSTYALDNDPEGILLQNGDVLFNVSGELYLYNYENREITLLNSFNNEYSRGYGYNNFKLLQNGNVITNNGDYLTITEFPLSKRELDRQNYDEISSLIKLIPDVKTLIREYL